MICYCGESAFGSAEGGLSSLSSAWIRLPLCSLLLYKIHSFRLFASGRSLSKNAVLCSDTSCVSFHWLLRLGAIRTVDSFLYIFESSREI